MPSISEKQHRYFEYKLHAKDSTPEERKVAKEFLDADKKAGLWQSDKIHWVLSIIQKSGRILIVYHINRKVWTLPMTKLKEGELETEAIKRDLEYKFGIVPTKYRYVKSLDPRLLIHVHCYTVTEFEGELINKRPTKLNEIKWVSRQQLAALGRLHMLDRNTEEVIEAKLL